MALIPIIFKADDVDNEKKGSVQGQDLAFFLAMGTSKSAGILDVLGSNACRVIGDPTISTGTATLTFNAGYIAIYGRLIYIEQGTRVEFELPTSGRVSGSLGVRISLADAGAMECSWFTKTEALRDDNLLKNLATGIYEFRLYDYTATPTDFSIRNQTSEIILGIKEYLEGNNFITRPLGDKTKHLATTEFVHKAINEAIKIHETDILSIKNNSVVGKAYRLGRYVIGYINAEIETVKGSKYKSTDYFKIDKSFAPKYGNRTLNFGGFTNWSSTQGSLLWEPSKAYIANLNINQEGIIRGREYCYNVAIDTVVPISITFGYDISERGAYNEAP